MNKEIPNNIIQDFNKAREDPIFFAENFLVDPTEKTPFRAKYAQKFIMGSKKRDVWICISRRSGKCLCGDSLVPHPTTLIPTPIKYLEKTEETFVFDFKSNQIVRSKASWIKSGKKKCIKLSLESGDEITLSTDHQIFCSKRGWIQASRLRIDDSILAVNEFPFFNNLTISQADLELLVDEALFIQNIPDSVYSLSKEWTTKFISELFHAKGRILHQFKSVTFMLWNREFSKSLKTLLLKFGVSSKLDEDGNLFITEEIDRAQLLSKLGFDYLVTEVRSPRRWDKVIGVKSVGEKDVYDLTVEHDDHNFIANNLVVHNSYALSILSIWHAIIKENQKIGIFAPASKQVDEFFDTIDRWIYSNPFLEGLLNKKGNHKHPQKRTFANGSSIAGHITGLVGGTEGSLRGLTFDICFVDEAQLLQEPDWKAIMPIMIGDQHRTKRMRCYMAGTTPDTPDNIYYKKIYKQTPSPNEEVILIPIDKNLSFTDQEREDIRLITPPRIWSQEYMLQLTESDLAVFKKSEIQMCSRLDWEYGSLPLIPSKPRFIGVDWDKIQAGTNIAVLEYDPYTQEVKTIYREEVPRSQFTYTNACRRVMELYETFTPEMVLCDQGQGEMQYETLQQFALERGSELAGRLEKVAFNQKIDVFDTITGEMQRKLIKPFLVGLLQKKFQEDKFRMPNHDEIMINQFLGYTIKETTQNTIKFKSENEHIIDCCSLAMYGIWRLYENSLFPKETHEIKSYNDFETPIQQFQEEQFWAQLEGPRTSWWGSQMPRTSIDDPFKHNSMDYFNLD